MYCVGPDSHDKLPGATASSGRFQGKAVRVRLLARGRVMGPRQPQFPGAAALSTSNRIIPQHPKKQSCAETGHFHAVRMLDTVVIMTFAAICSSVVSPTAASTSGTVRGLPSRNRRLSDPIRPHISCSNHYHHPPAPSTLLALSIAGSKGLAGRCRYSMPCASSRTPGNRGVCSADRHQKL
ncbi:hypothetical protein BDV96DRAFT_97274 [Lophiotrema nucula]|uniref:Uncharacterized protein n=1 Tax=Lophiotrema nucula TaxID=690887 RepID=A0A6A5Z5Q0_9PLEO|nr:hypothetical protein BDV96DRAFT_97274 [Lophiotrema nucula]